MSHSARLTLSLLAVTLTLAPLPSAAGQSTSGTPQDATNVRRLSVDEAVELALKNNLGLAVERINPLIQDAAVARARGFWAPTITSSFINNSASTPSTNVFSGGETKVTDNRFSTELGVTQTLPTGGRYSIAWNSARSSSTNIFTNFDPLLNADLRLAITQPLLRNFGIDDARQQLALSQRDRDASDLQLRSSIVLTTRNVRNAYWELTSQRDQLNAAQQSLDLSRRLLSDNERRVQVGTMAPIDIVEAQAEVARNEEAVILAEAAIQDAEDRLRALVFSPAAPDFWTMAIEPVDAAPFERRALDVDGAVRRALQERTDLLIAKNSLARSDINLRYFRNQVLPDISAQASYGATAVGGSQLTPLTSIPIGEPVARTVFAQRGFGSVLGDVLTNAFPAWTFGVNVSYPLGTSTEEATLARAKLEHTQRQTGLRNLELQTALEVRTVARQVQTNQKRVESTRVARELAERRLEAAEKKFAAGVETTFFVFQAQRDLAQARTNEVRAVADYNRSLVDFAAVQEVPLTATSPITVSGTSVPATNGTRTTP